MRTRAVHVGRTMEAMRAGGRRFRTIRAAFGMLCCIVAAGGAPCADGFTLRDDLHRDVAFARSPQRIVTMLPSLTETVCALGACDRLVATDRYSNWPQQVKALPKAGDLDDASIETIVGLRPDLILISNSQRITQRLRELGIPTFALVSERYADIARTVTLLGRILETPQRAADLNRAIEIDVWTVGHRATARRRDSLPTIYYEVDRALYAAGPQSFIGELLARLGTRNIVTADLGPFPKLNAEYVVRHDPDVIFVPRDSGRLADRPGWDTIRAVKEGRLCSFDAAVNDTIVRPGPRVADGMRALAGCLDRVAP